MQTQTSKMYCINEHFNGNLKALIVISFRTFFWLAWAQQKFIVYSSLNMFICVTLNGVRIFLTFLLMKWHSNRFVHERTSNRMMSFLVNRQMSKSHRNIFNDVVKVNASMTADTQTRKWRSSISKKLQYHVHMPYQDKIPNSKKRRSD